MRSETGAEAKETLGPGKLPSEGSDLAIAAQGPALAPARLLAPRITSADSARSILQLCKTHLAETFNRVMAFEIRTSFVEDVMMEQDVGPLIYAMRVRAEDLELAFPDGRTEPPTGKEALQVALILVQCAQLGLKLDKLYDLTVTTSEFSKAWRDKLATAPAVDLAVAQAMAEAEIPSAGPDYSALKIAIPVVAIIAGLVIWKRSKMK